MKNKFYNYIQNTIISEFEKIDGKAKIHEDSWQRFE